MGRWWTRPPGGAGLAPSCCGTRASGQGERRGRTLRRDIPGTDGEAFGGRAGEAGLADTRRILDLGQIPAEVARCARAEKAATGYSLVSWTGHPRADRGRSRACSTR